MALAGSHASPAALEAALARQAPTIPETGFVRTRQILACIPISRSSWWAGVKNGRFPAPLKLGPNTTCWRAEDIHALIDRLRQSAMSATERAQSGRLATPAGQG